MTPPGKQHSAPPDAGQLYARATAACARREYCRTDWLRKFAAGGLQRGEAEALVARLVEEGYIDETRYARAYVHDKVAFSRWGAAKIKQALRAKGLPADVADEALRRTDTADYDRNLRDLLQSRLRRLGSADPRAARQKLLRLAAARGYTLSAALRALNDLALAAAGDDDETGWPDTCTDE